MRPIFSRVFAREPKCGGSRFGRQTSRPVANERRQGRWLELSTERLEARYLLAGVVQAEMIGSTLQIKGDAAANDIIVEQSGATWSVTSGTDTTQVLTIGTLNNVQRLIARLGNGDDLFLIRNGTLSQDVLIEDGAGSKTIVVENIQSRNFVIDYAETPSNSLLEFTDVEVSGNFIVSDGAGAITLTMDATQVGRTLSVRDTGGNFEATLNDTKIGGSASIRTDGSGSHSIAVVDSQIVGNFSVTSKDGTSFVSVTGMSNIGRTLAFLETGGSSTMVMSDKATARSVRHTTQGGGDSQTVLQDEATVAGRVSAFNREGRSDVQIIDQAEIGSFSGSGFATSRNVAFAVRDGQSILADVYTPRSAGPHPAVILVHGGYWRLGSKSNMAAQAKALAERGYVAISIDYRLAPGNLFPAQIHDVKSAIMWARANAAELDLDPANIGIYGFSAGAQLALLAGLTTPAAGLDGPDAGLADTAVQAIVAAGAPTDFQDTPLNSIRFWYLFGGTRAQLPDLYQDASPAYWVSSDDPPTFLFVGENDNVISQPKLQAFRDSLIAEGVTTEYYVAAGRSHLATPGDRLSRLYAERFLDGQLKA